MWRSTVGGSAADWDGGRPRDIQAVCHSVVECFAPAVRESHSSRFEWRRVPCVSRGFVYERLDWTGSKGRTGFRQRPTPCGDSHARKMVG
jgi:hypothetical protein